MSLLDVLEAELKRRRRYGPSTGNRVNWPIERIVALVEYARANEQQRIEPHRMAACWCVNCDKFKAARKALGLGE